jgi:serine/threonine protein phosphatase PrpC
MDTEQFNLTVSFKPLKPMSNDKPLKNRYLWAMGEAAARIPVGECIADRYEVVAPQIWQDTQPELPPQTPELIGESLLPYLRLYPHRLHVPEVYGTCPLPEGEAILLENVPVDDGGQLYPTLEAMWWQASAIRQVYWLWQILELWTPLADLGVAASLLVPGNLRVEGWRVRLQQLYADPVEASTPLSLNVERSRDVEETEGIASRVGDADGSEQQTSTSTQATAIASPTTPRLQQLGEYWQSLCDKASVAVAPRLQEISQQLQGEKPAVKAIAARLNLLLLEQAARQPLRLQVIGATDSGSRHKHNEDSCYPQIADLPTDSDRPYDPLIPHLSIVCDGIGGHEGGEIASQLAVQTIKLQVRALLAELAEDPEIATPETIAQQLEATIRVANNLIAARNDQQERESRRRMATTLTLALQIPQRVPLPEGEGNACELYIASVGDSRAYWLTPRYCQPLTVDDDVVTREVRMGRSCKRSAMQRPDAQALTQAVGTRDSELLRPSVRRFILEEDGLLLLCSDGLSDNNLVEQYCGNLARDVFSGKIDLESAVQWLIQLANERNGHDNTSVVLTYCAVTPLYPAVLDLGELSVGEPTITINPELVTVQPYDAEEAEAIEEVEIVSERGTWFKAMLGAISVLVVILSVGAALLTAQWLTDPEGFQEWRDRLFRLEPLESPEE